MVFQLQTFLKAKQVEVQPNACFLFFTTHLGFELLAFQTICISHLPKGPGAAQNWNETCDCFGALPIPPEALRRVSRIAVTGICRVLHVSEIEPLG